MSLLNVHHKIREVQTLDKIDLEVELLKLENKHRYKNMGQGDEIENMGKAEMDKALKKLDKEREHERLDRQVVKDNMIDITKVILTEMKFNTKVYP